MKKKTDHIIIDLATNEGVCTRCGGRELPKLPMPIDAFVAWTKYFIKRHENCKEQS